MTDVPALIHDRETAAGPFDTIYDILRSLSIAQSDLKGRNVPIWRQWEPRHMTQSGTDWLVQIKTARSGRRRLPDDLEPWPRLSTDC